MEEEEGADREAVKIHKLFKAYIKDGRKTMKKEKNRADIQVNQHIIYCRVRKLVLPYHVVA